MNKVICDQMLGSLAKWLRILGIDTYFAENTIDDTEILKIALDDERVLITRDKELFIRAQKHKIPSIQIRSTDLTTQLHTALATISIDRTQFFSRCILCNTLVYQVDKIIAMPHIPPKVSANNEIFLYCPSCDKYYWRGSHYEKIKQTISDILEYTTG